MSLYHIFRHSGVQNLDTCFPVTNKNSAKKRTFVLIDSSMSSSLTGLIDERKIFFIPFPVSTDNESELMIWITFPVNSRSSSGIEASAGCQSFQIRFRAIFALFSAFRYLLTSLWLHYYYGRFLEWVILNESLTLSSFPNSSRHILQILPWEAIQKCFHLDGPMFQQTEVPLMVFWMDVYGFYQSGSKLRSLFRDSKNKFIQIP